MKVMILAGGFGSRISDVDQDVPKPMIILDDKPIIEHIINIYRNYKLKKFIILTGYKHSIVKKFFIKNSKRFSDCEINIFNTGINTLTGSRILKARKFIKEENFIVTYGDGLSDIDIDKLIKFHKKSNNIGTITAVRPPARFGELLIENKMITKFNEKIQLNKNWINGGFFVFKKNFFNLIPKKNTMLETFPIQNLIKIKSLNAYKHAGYWQCIDNRRDLNSVKNLIIDGNTPWIKKS